MEQLLEHKAETMPFGALLTRSFGYSLILIGAGLISAQLRYDFAFGLPLGDEYNPLPLMLWVILLVGAVCGSLIIEIFSSLSRFLSLIFGLIISVVGIIAFLPDISQMQVVYFAVSAVVIALITLVITPQKVSFSGSIRNLGQSLPLLRLWVRYNVLSRYSQTFLGILWIVMLPVTTAVILSFVFSHILEPHDIGGAPFIAFFLTGLMFWTFFSQGILNGTVSILAKLGLISQIYFPREVLVLVKLGEAFVDLSFIFVITMVMNVFVGVLPNLNFVYLPLLFAIQVTLMLGLMFFFSYLAVLIRDVQQLTSVIIQMMFYLTPIMYPLSILPDRLGEILRLLNPMAALVTAYLDVIVYNRPPNMLSLYVPMVISAILFYSGYMFFKANERKLADFR